MTNTDTADIEGTVAAGAGPGAAPLELVRITVNSSEAAAPVAPIRRAARARRRARAADR